MSTIKQTHTTLGKISSLVTSGSRGWADYYSETGALFLRMTNLPKEGIGILLHDNKFVSLPSSSSEGKRTNVQKNDILISITAELGKIGFVENDLGEAYVNQHVALVRISSPNASPKYLAYYLAAAPQRKLLQCLNDAGAKAGLSLQTINKFPVTLPPISEQTAIASLFSTWDLAIEKAERLIAAKERHFLWFSKKLLFGDVTDSANTSKKTKWFSVPDHWKVVNIGKIANEVSTFNNSAENIPVLSCTKYDGLVDSLTYFNKQVFSLDTSTYKVVTKGQFAYATNHIEEGSIGYQDVYDKGLVSPMYTAFETNKNVDDSYLYKVLKSVVYLHIFRANTSSSVDRRGSLRWKEFAKLPIPLPPIEEQKRIAAILTTARQEIDLLKKRAEAYRRQKRGLMQKLLTGEWRVKLGGDEHGLGTD
jgi:type I restriction enzyme S subunit